MKYARYTTVSPEKTQASIRKVIEQYGGTNYSAAFTHDMAAVAFRFKTWQIRFELPLPDVRRMTKSAYDQVTRQRWRALRLSILSKLEAVESGIYTLEEAFLYNIVLPGGELTGKWALPQLQKAYQTGQPPALMRGTP